MAEFVQDKLRLARKMHKCEACDFPIPKRAEYIVSSQIYEGSWMASKWHTECREQFGNMLAHYGENEGNPSDTWEDTVMPQHFVAKYILLGGE